MSLQVAFLLKELGADVTLDGFHTNVMNVRHVLLQCLLPNKHLRAQLTVEDLDVPDAVNGEQVYLQRALVSETFSAKVTLKPDDVMTNTMNSSHMHTHVASFFKFAAADVTRVYSAWTIWSFRVPRCSMRRLMVNVDR